ncbi:VOC family protein [Shimazuella sp. AN120528]|uniref:VOC family protein n=1 Tax=Shimazuella soli TaxID=1892854 RepID=UPI001F0EDA88|nr:VOC family protein [Shimazuella soli]MCH5585097.1 VOC family protein [Shimazuella soli]
MIHTEPIIAVSNVADSLNWYTRLLDCHHTHTHNEVFDQLIDQDGKILLCLHRWGDHQHPSLEDPDKGQPGNGLLLFFRLDHFDAAWERAQALGTPIEARPHYNPFVLHQEFTLKDPDGYYITICSLRDKQ